tara:strand:- start:859 stop:1938 length:1080 start_codon:yes stop_codon:yes gene_type:complete
MSVHTVSFLGDVSMIGTHNSGSGVYVRSSAAADDDSWYLFGRASSDSSAASATLAVGSNEGKIEALSSTAWSDLYLASHRSSATTENNLTGQAEVRSNNGTAATGTITILSQPADGDTLEIGLTGFTKTFTWETGTPSTNGQVKSVSDTGNCAINLASAINDAAIGGSYASEGTDWTNTDGANPYLTATVSGSTITLSDKIACSRQLSFVTTASDSDKVSVSPIRGGVDGTLVAEIAAGNASASSTIISGVDLDAENQTTSTLPPGIAGPSNVIQTRGRFAVDIRLASAPDAALALKVELSNDGENFFDAPTSTVENLNSNQTQRLVADDLFSEFMRLNVTSNASTVANPALIKVISQS